MIVYDRLTVEISGQVMDSQILTNEKIGRLRAWQKKEREKQEKVKRRPAKPPPKKELTGYCETCSHWIKDDCLGECDLDREDRMAEEQCLNYYKGE